MKQGRLSAGDYRLYFSKPGTSSQKLSLTLAFGLAPQPGERKDGFHREEKQSIKNKKLQNIWCIFILNGNF